MQIFRFHRSHLDIFDDQHVNLVYHQDMYLNYIHRVFSLENVGRQLHEKQDNYTMSRSALVDALKAQYDGLEKGTPVAQSIEALRDNNTFTITTGHQLSLFTGPMFFVVKILHVIKLCKLLKERNPEANFIPVFWMATEDHDFEEIQSTHLFNQTLTWESDQQGPVGRFTLDGLDAVKDQLTAFFERNSDAEIHKLIKAYTGKNLAEATRNLVHALFQEYGLVIIDGDDPSLKQSFSPIVKKELTEQFSQAAVEKTNETLKKEGGKLQVHAREINLFYIQDGIRSRIVKAGEHFEVEGIGSFTLEELLLELEQHPERFSPNVILRPLYQETILPNLTYIGGVGEISYWLQLKGVFDAVNCLYPLIAVRNSVTWIDGGISKKITKIDMVLEDIFKDVDLIKREYIESHAEDLDLEELDRQSKLLSDLVQDAILKVDPTKISYAEAELKRLSNQINGIKEKLIKQSKSKHEQAMKSIEQIIGRLFPDGKLQERSTNFFSLCPDGAYKDRLNKLYTSLDPEENDFILIREI